MAPTTIDPENLKEFTSRAEEWWDPEGAFKPLHALNPVRLEYIKAQIEAHFSRQKDQFSDLSILDVGCGGGLVTEPLADTGARVTGLDAGEENIQAAQDHATLTGRHINYVCTSLEAYTPPGLFDVVLALEIVEHVACVETFVKEVMRVVKPGGLVLFSTLNRTLKSFALAIVGAE